MEKEKYLGEFEQFVLLSILKLGNQAYGTKIRSYLADTIQRDVSVGALYTTLERLEKKGFVSSELGESTSERGGRSKKYFTVTAQGNLMLKKSKQALNKMWSGLVLTRQYQ